MGYNYQEYRYSEDHTRYPKRILYGSENGMLWSHWDSVARNPYICGQFLWTGIDYLGEAHSWPKRSNSAGLMDLAGFPKSEYYYRQSLWSDKPMVRLGTCAVSDSQDKRGLWDQYKAERRWAPIMVGGGGNSSATQECIHVACFSNCETVELFLNGRSMGIESPDDSLDRVASWNIQYEAGKITCVGRNDGVVVATDELCSTGCPVKLLAVADSSLVSVDPDDLAHIVVSVVDAAGNLVIDDDREVTWSIDGPGNLLGIENGDHSSHEPYRSSRRRTFHGRQLGYVRATLAEQTIKLTLSSGDLGSATVLIRT